VINQSFVLLPSDSENFTATSPTITVGSNSPYLDAKLPPYANGDRTEKFCKLVVLFARPI